MKYDQTVILKNGITCHLRSGKREDGAELLRVFNKTHEESDFLLTYPDENNFTVEQECDFLEKSESDPRKIEILAIIDGKVVGSAGIESIGSKDKIRHRADFGVSILKDYQRMGIGKALTQACITCAKSAGYTQIELQVVADNLGAISLYKECGFQEFGRNAKGFLSRKSGYQELIYMQLAL